MIILNALNTIKAIYILPQSGCDIFPKSQKMKLLVTIVLCYCQSVYTGMHDESGFAPLIVSYMYSFEKFIHE